MKKLQFIVNRLMFMYGMIMNSVDVLNLHDEDIMTGKITFPIAIARAMNRKCLNDNI